MKHRLFDCCSVDFLFDASTPGAQPLPRVACLTWRMARFNARNGGASTEVRGEGTVAIVLLANQA